MIVWLVLAAVLAYAIYSGVLRKPLRHEAVAGGLIFLAAILASRGSAYLALAAGAAAAAAYLTGETAHRRASAQEAKACGLLGLQPGATPEAVRAAHRRLSAVTHPDRGGTHAAQQELNWARDLLLRRTKAAMR